MCFGLDNAAQTFHYLMDDILQGLDFCFSYFVDILVFSRSLEQHEQHLRALFDQLQRYGILTNQTKCVFRAPEASLLGYKVSAGGSQKSGRTSDPSLGLPTSQDRHQLRRCMEMLNFYRIFLPHVAATQAPLNNFLSSPRVKGSHPITWTPELLQDFEECKASLSRGTLLAHPDPSTPLALVIDASTFAIGAELQKRV
jgi:hypothetical protein